jgi:hypothetical protein
VAVALVAVVLGTATGGAPGAAVAPGAAAAPAQGVAAGAVDSCAGATMPQQDAQRFVTETYRRLFGRDPDAGGLWAWTASLGQGAPRTAVADAITSSTEYRSRLVRDVYDEYLGRLPDPAGLAFWVASLAGGGTAAQIAVGFLASDESWARAGATPRGWVTTLYRTVLDRDPAPAEADYWSGRLVAGASRAAIAAGFVLSEEHLSTVVDGYYRTVLDRGIDESGRAYWVRQLQAGAHDEAIVGGLVGSPEFCAAAVAPGTTLSVVPSVTRTVAGQPYTVAVVSHRTGHPDRDVTAEAHIALVGYAETACAGATCTPTTAGMTTVRASWDGQSGTAEVQVDPGPASRLVIQPDGVQVSGGSTVQAFVSGATDAWGNGTAVPTPLAFAVDGSTAACSGAVCTLGGPGAHTISAASAGASGQAHVTVTARGAAHASLVGWGTVGDVPLGSSPVALGVGSDWSWLGAGLGDPATVLGARTDGTLWGWGGAVPGRSATQTPVQAAWDRGWVATAHVPYTQVGLRSDGTAWIWPGWIDPASSVTDGRPSRLDSRTDGVELFGGPDADTAFLLRADGTLWSLGYQGYGLAGRPATDDIYTPVQVGHDADWASVSVGMFHALATKTDGTLWAWGWNGLGNGALGTGSTSSDLVERTPVRVGTASDWVEVAAGMYTSAGVRADGTLWVWGKTTPTGLADVAPELRRTTPTSFGTGRTWRHVRLAEWVGAAQADDGTWWTWGTNTVGQLGDGTTASRTDPQPVPGSAGWLDVVLVRQGAIALAPAVP